VDCGYVGWSVELGGRRGEGSQARRVFGLLEFQGVGERRMESVQGVLSFGN
jgi:hypothetical protein